MRIRPGIFLSDLVCECAKSNDWVKVKVSPGCRATTDEQLTEILSTAKASRRIAVVNYGASWCQACKQMLPTFCNLSNEYPSSLFVYADIDKCEHTTQDVRYTPTFRFYKDGTRVDEFYGGGAQKLRDRVWLQS